MAGDFLAFRSGSDFELWFLAFVSTTVAVYVLFLKSILRPGACANKT